MATTKAAARHTPACKTTFLLSWERVGKLPRQTSSTGTTTKSIKQYWGLLTTMSGRLCIEAAKPLHAIIFSARGVYYTQMCGIANHVQNKFPAALGSHIHEQMKLFPAKGAAAVPEVVLELLHQSCTWLPTGVLGCRKAPKEKRAFDARLCLHRLYTPLCTAFDRTTEGLAEKVVLTLARRGGGDA